MPRAQSHSYTAPYTGDEPYVFKSQAISRFNLSEADLRALDPLSVERNEHNFTMIQTKYSLADVLRLAEAIHSRVGLYLPQNKGRKDIVKTGAVKGYQLTAKRIEAALTPSRRVQYDWRVGTHYWLSDIRALAQQGRNIRQIWADEGPAQE